MSQAADKLHEALHDLEGALQSHDAVDPEVRQRLEQAIGEIRAALVKLPAEQSGGEAIDDDESLTGQLASVARDFEGSHPTLSGMVGSVIDALARMGI